jgi:hypothetical protein
MIGTWLPASLFLVFVLATGALAHLAAVGRSPSKDCGGFWAQVVDRLCIWLGIPVLILSSIRTLDFVKMWQPEWWLAAVGIGWLLILLLGIIQAPSPEEGRWIAGTLEFSPHRFWLLLFFLPFLPALFYTAPPWTEDVYAAHWAVVIAFLIALAGCALSASPVHSWEGLGRKAEQDSSLALSPWPEEMRSRGIGLQAIVDWEQSADPAPISGTAAEWQRRLSALGSPGVSGPLCEAVSKLMTWAPQRSEPVAIVLGPDQCGQEEVTALVATELSRRHSQTTLVITSAPDSALAGRLSRWLNLAGGENPLHLLDLSTDNGSVLAGDLLLVDAETLSDVVLDQLRGEIQNYGEASGQGRGLGRIGLVIWWNAHEFSGVLAANVWAVSRRLERLLKSRSGLPPRAVVFARRPREREVAFLAFLEHLLPYPWTKDNELQIGTDFARKTHLYRLEDRSPVAVRQATEASLLTGWPTLPTSDNDLPAVLSHAPALSVGDAGARILDIRPAEVLSLQEIICQGGRCTPPRTGHHVAIAANENPYVEFLLSRSGSAPDAAASVHLISAEGHPELVRRHLLLALREVPDTLTGLRASFRWEEEMLRNTLRRLSAEDRLSREPVRFLDSSGRLQRDSRYANQNPGQSAVRSFRVIGRSRPVELRDPNVRDRLLMQIDPERLPIDAYPMRVFESQGRRYRVQRWTDAAPPTRIACIPAESELRTWRFATSRINLIKRSAEPLTFRGMQRYTARASYHEDVTGILERDSTGAFHTIGIDPVRTTFETEALILEFTDAFEPVELISAVAALRHVLPVHTAIDEDALEVVAFSSQNRRGLALVDLYPGGVGVVNAMHKTVWMIPMLFDRAAQWLSHADAAGGNAIQNLSQSPIVRTMGIKRLDLRGALRLFASAAMQTR